MCIRDRVISQLLCGSETWIRKAEDISRIQEAEMLFLRGVKDCTRRNLNRNHIRVEVGTAESLNNKNSQYKTQ